MRLLVPTARLLGGAPLAECPVSRDFPQRSFIQPDIILSSSDRTTARGWGGGVGRRREARGADRQFLSEFVSVRRVCVTKETCVNDDEHDGDTMTALNRSLAVQSGKLSLHDTGDSAHTDTHTHTHGLKEGRQWGAQSEGCFMHAYSAYGKRERERASEV